MQIRDFCSKVGCGFQDMHLIHICLVKGSELFKCFVLQCCACGKHAQRRYRSRCYDRRRRKAMKRVLIDCDGVLSDFMTPAMETMNKLLGTNKKLSDLKSWHLFDAFEPELVVTEYQRAQCYDVWKQPGWCRALEPLPGACAGVARLQNAADVFIVTSPMNGPTWAYEREEWLKHYFHLDRRNVISTDAKFTVGGDFLIDDKTEHCELWGRCNPDGRAIRWKAPTNRVTPYAGITMDSWSSLFDLVNFHDYKEHRSWTHLLHRT